MGVDQAGQDHLALEVDHPGVLAGHGFHVVVGADFQKFPIPDGERLGTGSDTVHRVDKTVFVHRVGFASHRRMCGHEQRQHDCSTGVLEHPGHLCHFF